MPIRQSWTSLGVYQSTLLHTSRLETGGQRTQEGLTKLTSASTLDGIYPISPQPVAESEAKHTWPKWPHWPVWPSQCNLGSNVGEVVESGGLTQPILNVTNLEPNCQRKFSKLSKPADLNLHMIRGAWGVFWGINVPDRGTVGSGRIRHPQPTILSRGPHDWDPRISISNCFLSIVKVRHCENVTTCENFHQVAPYNTLGISWPTYGTRVPLG